MSLAVDSSCLSFNNYSCIPFCFWLKRSFRKSFFIDWDFFYFNSYLYFCCKTTMRNLVMYNKSSLIHQNMLLGILKQWQEYFLWRVVEQKGHFCLLYLFLSHGNISIINILLNFCKKLHFLLTLTVQVTIKVCFHFECSYEFLITFSVF